MKRIMALAFALIVVAAPVFAASQWSTVGGDSGNTRYSSLEQINAQNVAKLGAAWMSEKISPPPSSRGVPVIDKDLMFLTSAPFVYAVNISTGKIAWRYRTTAAEGGGIMGPPGSPGREGVAVGGGLVYVGLTNANLIALREETGELVWKTYLGDPVHAPSEGASGAPLYADGLVSVGLNADYGYRGQIVAVDAKTGREAWRFFVVPSPGDPGSETWPKSNDSWKHGGGAVWLVGATDPELGLVFYATGNAVPQYGGENRPGDNLFTDCVVALDAKTGKLRWHYQMVHHDIWEADVAEAPVLFDAQINGQPRKAIAAMRTDGYLFMLDRVTGKPLDRVEERPVPQEPSQKTVPTQPYPVGAEPVLPDCGYWKTQPVAQGFDVGCFFTAASAKKPNVLVPVYGMRATPMAFDPQTRFFYATGNAGLQWFRRSQDPDFFTLSLTSRVPGLSKLGFGVLAAIDTRTDKIAWKRNSTTCGRAARSPPPGASCFRWRATATCRRTMLQTDLFCGSFKPAISAGARRSALKMPANSTSPQLSAATCGRSRWAERSRSIQPLPFRLRKNFPDKSRILRQSRPPRSRETWASRAPTTSSTNTSSIPIARGSKPARESIGEITAR